MSATLLILAAGLGTRFGDGIKQLTPIGKNGETLMELSIMDAVEAGFDNVIFVIRRDIESQIRMIVDKLSNTVHAEYCFQDIEKLNWTKLRYRTKPWGTVHTVISAKEHLNEPFAVINADDYYGKNSYKDIYKFLTAKDRKPEEQCMGGFILEKTLSHHCEVTRGICKIGGNFMLTDIEEVYGVIQCGKGIKGFIDDEITNLNPNSIVSMNMWGFDSSIITKFETLFHHFLFKYPGFGDEYPLPVAVKSLIHSGDITVKVIPVYDKWYGMTSSEDVYFVKNGLT